MTGRNRLPHGDGDQGEDVTERLPPGCVVWFHLDCKLYEQGITTGILRRFRTVPAFLRETRGHGLHDAATRLRLLQMWRQDTSAPWFVVFVVTKELPTGFEVIVPPSAVAGCEPPQFGIASN